MSDTENDIIIITEDLIDIIEDLINMIETEDKRFFKIYQNLPFNYYYSIEQLSYSRSLVNKDICDKARTIASKFHKSIK